MPIPIHGKWSEPNEYQAINRLKRTDFGGLDQFLNKYCDKQLINVTYEVVTEPKLITDGKENA